MRRSERTILVVGMLLLVIGLAGTIGTVLLLPELPTGENRGDARDRENGATPEYTQYAGIDNPAGGTIARAESEEKPGRNTNAGTGRSDVSTNTTNDDPDEGSTMGRVELRVTRQAVSGAVRGPDGSEIVGARISLTKEDENGNLVGDSIYVTTDADGGFDIPGVPSGRYSMTVEAEGYRTSRIRRLEIDTDEEDEEAFEPREVRVFVRQTNGSMIPGATICWNNKGAPFQPSGPIDPSGDFALEADGIGRAILPAVRWEKVWVQVSAVGFATRYARITVHTQPGGPNDTEPVDTTVPVTAVVTLQESARIDGRVQSMGGVGVGGVAVRIRSANDPDQPGQLTTTDVSGRFELAGVPTGLVFVTLSKPGYAETEGGPYLISGNRSNTLPDLTIIGLTSLAVKVVDMADNPVNGATVEVENGGVAVEITIGGMTSTVRLPQSIETTSTGWATITFLPPGQHWIKVSAEGAFAPREVLVTVPPAEQGVEQITVRLDLGTSLRMLVLDPDGNPAGEVPITLIPVNGTAGDPRTAMTDRQGDVYFPRLAGGPHAMQSAAGEILVEGADVVQIPSDRPAVFVEATLFARTPTTIQVIRHTGEPINGVPVWVGRFRSSDNRPMLEHYEQLGETGGDGYVELPDGENLELTGAHAIINGEPVYWQILGGIRDSIMLVAPSRTSRDCSFDFELKHSLSGLAIAGATVEVVRIAGEDLPADDGIRSVFYARGTSEPNGTVAIHEVPAGRYVIRINGLDLISREWEDELQPGDNAIMIIDDLTTTGYLTLIIDAPPIEGQAMPEITVELRDAETGNTLTISQTDGSIPLIFSNLRVNQPYEARISAPGYITKVEPVHGGTAEAPPMFVNLDRAP